MKATSCMENYFRKTSERKGERLGMREKCNLVFVAGDWSWQVVVGRISIGQWPFFDTPDTDTYTNATARLWSRGGQHITGGGNGGGSGQSDADPTYLLLVVLHCCWLATDDDDEAFTHLYNIEFQH